MDRNHACAEQANHSSHAPAGDPADTDLRKYCEVINGIDSMCQNHLGQIRTIVTTMLRAMETPEFWRHPTDISELLGLIQYTADDLMNFVNGSAETVGSHYIDETGRARDRRVSEAFDKACQARVDHVSGMKSLLVKVQHG